MIKIKIRNIFFITALAAMTLFSACGKKTETPPENVDMAPFTPPGDFVWEGTYLDKVSSLAVLNIEKQSDGYLCVISVPDQEITHIESYSFKAKPASDGIGLSYTGGERTSLSFPAAGQEDKGVTSEDIYNDGTGRVYYLEGSVFWLDEKDGSGEGLIFEKVEEESGEDEVSGNSAE